MHNCREKDTNGVPFPEFIGNPLAISKTLILDCNLITQRIERVIRGGKRERERERERPVIF